MSAISGNLRSLLVLKSLVGKSRTNPDEPITVAQLAREVEEQAAKLKGDTFALPNVKALKEDIALLEKLGLIDFSISSRRGKGGGLVIGRSSSLTDEEVILLSSIVNACSVITDEQAAELYAKLQDLLPEDLRERLLEHTYVDARNRAEINRTLSNTVKIVRAIQEEMEIVFVYLGPSRFFDPSGKPRVYPREHSVVPIKLIYSFGNYYLEAFEERREGSGLVLFRLDRMTDIGIGGTPQRHLPEIQEARKGIEERTAATFESFRDVIGAEPVEVLLRVGGRAAPDMYERFGVTSYMLKSGDNEWGYTTVKVYPSAMFYKWLFGWDGTIELANPSNELVLFEMRDWFGSEKLQALQANYERVSSEYRKMLEKAAKGYEESNQKSPY